MTPSTFHRGDRVRTNDLWTSMAAIRRQARHRGHRQGRILHEPHKGSDVYAVLWDGRSTVDYVARRFLELEEGREQTMYEDPVTGKPKAGVRDF